MDFIEVIQGRRSIRKYTDKPIDDAIVDKLLQAGMAAPSAYGDRPWHFVAIRSRETMQGIIEVHPYAKMLADAPVGVAICADMNTQREPEAGFWIQDCSAAAENILLAAHASGLGGCWLAIHPRAQRKARLRELLNLPDHIEPFCMIALGYPAEQKEAHTECDTARIHRESW